MSCGGEGHHVRRLAAGDERDRDAGRQAEQLREPGASDLLDDRRRRAGDVDAGVLVPGRRQPVGRQRGRNATADDEAEVAAAGHTDESVVGGARELGDDRARIRRAVRQPASEPGAQLLDGCAREDRPAVERLEEVGGEVDGAVQQVTQLAHPPNPITPAAASAPISSSE